jgi:ribosome-binding factor A
MQRIKRSRRVGDAVREEIARILLRDLKDPRVGFVTVTDVALSDDLRYAKIFYTVYGGTAEREKSAKGLESARGFIRTELGRRIRLKYVPDISFVFDPSIEYGNTMDSLLDSLHRGGENT